MRNRTVRMHVELDVETPRYGVEIADHHDHVARHIAAMVAGLDGRVEDCRMYPSTRSSPYQVPLGVLCLHEWETFAVQRFDDARTIRVVHECSTCGALRTQLRSMTEVESP